MEAFILAGLMFHVGAAASLALISAIAGLRDARRRAIPCKAARNATATIAAMSVDTASHASSAAHVISHGAA
jgi:hypothetical protein